MRWPLLVFLLISSAPSLLHAQETEETQGEIACHEDRDDNAPYKKKLWDGYEVSLGPAKNGGCTAAIYSKEGKVVFRTNGMNVVFNEDLTGEDFDGDGKPEVVFKTDTGGGTHCCWAYIVYSLSPKPHKLFEIAEDGKVDFEKDKNGKMTVWQRAGGLISSTMADRAFAEKVFQVRAGNLEDITPEFCSTKDDRFERYEPRPEDSTKLENVGEPEHYDLDRLVSALESRALQEVYCHQFDSALKVLNVWPAEKRKQEMSHFADAIKDDYPEFASKLSELAKKD